MKTLSTKELERIETMKRLRKLIGRKKVVYTKVEHVSASGMSRIISCFVVTKDGIANISYDVAKIVGWGFKNDKGLYGIKVSGCGMDMGFHLIYSLSYCLYKDKTKGKDAGYTVTQRWL